MISTEPMKFKKINKIEGNNITKLTSSLRGKQIFSKKIFIIIKIKKYIGLISVVNEENKLLIYDQS